MLRALKKIIFTGILAFVIAFLPFQIHSSRAFWGEFVQENYHYLLKEVHDLIRATIMGMLQQQAVESLNQEVNSKVGGSSSQNAMFITDWEDYMKQPEKNAKRKVMNDYLSQATKGRGSALAYVPENSASKIASGKFEGVGPGSFFFGITADNPLYGRIASAAAKEASPNSLLSSSNYVNSLEKNVQSSIIEPKNSSLTYEGDPSNMFKSKDGFYNMSLFLSGINHPAAFDLYMQQKYREEVETEEDIARTKAIAYQGFKGTEKNGKTVNPGSVVKENVVNVQDMGNQLIVNADHPAELLTAIVAQYLQKALEGGWNNVQSNLYRDTESVKRNAEKEKAREIKENGPGAMYRR